jgi:hypothetical protein
MTTILKGYYLKVTLENRIAKHNGRKVYLSIVEDGNGIPDNALILKTSAKGNKFSVCLSIRSQCGWKELIQNSQGELIFDLKVEVTSGKSTRAPLFPLVFQLCEKTRQGVTLLSQCIIPVKAITKIPKKALHAQLVAVNDVPRDPMALCMAVEHEEMENDDINNSPLDDRDDICRDDDDDDDGYENDNEPVNRNGGTSPPGVIRTSSSLSSMSPTPVSSRSPSPMGCTPSNSHATPMIGTGTGTGALATEHAGMMMGVGIGVGRPNVNSSCPPGELEHLAFLSALATMAGVERAVPTPPQHQQQQQHNSLHSSVHLHDNHHSHNPFLSLMPLAAATRLSNLSCNEKIKEILDRDRDQHQHHPAVATAKRDCEMVAVPGDPIIPVKKLRLEELN